MQFEQDFSFPRYAIRIRTFRTEGYMVDLNYDQRKALRRLGRDQTISRTMQNDPIIQECYSTAHYIYPRKDMNVVEYCDWEAQARSINHPRINDYGKQLLKELEDTHDR